MPKHSKYHAQCYLTSFDAKRLKTSLHQVDAAKALVIPSCDEIQGPPYQRTAGEVSSWMFNGENEALFSYIIRLSKKLDRPLVILDAGCGASQCIDDLLSNAALAPYIKRIVGISLDHFDNTASVLAKHPKRFHYYHAAVEDILAKKPLKFDLIYDFAGPVLYSPNTLRLFQLFYQSLNMKGNIILYNTGMLSNRVIIDGEKLNLWAVFNRLPPGTITLSFEPEEPAVQICKLALRFPTYGASKVRSGEFLKTAAYSLSTSASLASNALSIYRTEIETADKPKLRPLLP